MTTPRTYGACGGCGYDVTNVIGSSETCPECGNRLSEVGVVPKKVGGRGGPGRTRVLLIVVCIAAALISSVLVMGIAFSFRARQQALAQRAAAERAAVAAQIQMIEQTLATQQALARQNLAVSPRAPDGRAWDVENLRDELERRRAEAESNARSDEKPSTTDDAAIDPEAADG